MAKRGGGLISDPLRDIIKQQAPSLFPKLDAIGDQTIKQAISDFDKLSDPKFMPSKQLVGTISSGGTPSQEQISAFKSQEELRKEAGIKQDFIFGKTGSVSGYQTPGLKLPSQFNVREGESLSQALGRQGIKYPVPGPALISERYSSVIPRNVLDESLSDRPKPRIGKRPTAGAAYTPFGETKELFARY